MGKKYEEYQKIIASVYVLLILAMLPVYMKDGMNMIGDAKYIFYRNASMTLLPLWFLGTAAAFLYRRRKKEVLFPSQIFLPQLLPWYQACLICSAIIRIRHFGDIRDGIWD